MQRTHRCPAGRPWTCCSPKQAHSAHLSRMGGLPSTNPQRHPSARGSIKQVRGTTLRASVATCSHLQATGVPPLSTHLTGHSSPARTVLQRERMCQLDRAFLARSHCTCTASGHHLLFHQHTRCAEVATHSSPSLKGAITKQLLPGKLLGRCPFSHCLFSFFFQAAALVETGGHRQSSSKMPTPSLAGSLPLTATKSQVRARTWTRDRKRGRRPSALGAPPGSMRSWGSLAQVRVRARCGRHCVLSSLVNRLGPGFSLGL